jgi:hypothetical protein
MEDVDLWAPYTVLVGADPDFPANEARTVGGTSFSTPYVAGVLALILAADPSLNGNEALGILKDTAQWGSGFVVGKYPDAYAAVTTALGGNLPPEFTVFQPVESLLTGRGQMLRLDAVTSDPDGPIPQVEWRLDGQVLIPAGPGSNSTQHWLTRDNITLGAHAITASIADGVYQPVITRHFTVENTPPVVEILSPSSMTSVCLSCVLNLEAADPTDPDEALGGLSGEQLAWRTGGMTIATGVNATVYGGTFGIPGVYWLELRGSDSNGAIVTDSVQIIVTEDPDDLPPVVAIFAPENGGSAMVDASDGNGWYKLVILSGAAYDPESLDPPYIGSELFPEWTVTQTFGVPQPAPVFVGSSTDYATTVKLYNNGPDETVSYEITLTVTEEDGPSSSDTVTYSIRTIS